MTIQIYDVQGLNGTFGFSAALNGRSVK